MHGMQERPSEIPPHKLITALRGYGLLPAIIFLPTRRKCDESALEVAADKRQPADNEKAQRRQELFDQMAAASPEIRRHKHAKVLVHAGVASHHAGHIPSWKLTIEKMMSAGLLNAIFATSTVAAGVDFPARTVVISNADTRGNDGWRSLTVNELQQMTGRAGRRGKDLVGFAILAPGQFQDPKKIAKLLRLEPDPLESKFRATYTSLINLLDAYGNFEQVREIAEKSYAFQDTLRKVTSLRQRQAALEKDLVKPSVPGGQPLSLEDIRGFERLISSRQRIVERMPATRAELRQRWLEENVQPGRVVTQGRSAKRFFLVISVHGDSVSAMRDDGQGKKFALSRVNRVYGNTYRLSENTVESAFLDTLDGKNPPLNEPKPSAHNVDGDSDEVLGKLIEEMAAKTPQLWQTVNEAAELDRIERDIAFLRSRIWEPFMNRAKVLDHFDFLDIQAEKVTDGGKWLADLRIDRPLPVGEALSRGIFDELEPATLAGLIAALAADSDRDFGGLYLSDELLDAVSRFENVAYDVAKVELRFGIAPAEELNLSAAAAAEHWAGGMAWNTLVTKTKAEEGDLVRLLSRTGEALMQIAHLHASNPKAASTARTAAEIILRDPIR